ncbi:serine/threonine-protein kinase [Nannocystis sp.]|uniref:serine/threonine-protein kinase n=1 Tax=Nannocystis sp. TaxID=1962667 RepID=UPI0025DB9D10|nr:serine/threonine-protein kinase [Nannocystis sp.]MBK7828134.1 serine/threonine protein kinase [Nannocystis sp.]
MSEPGDPTQAAGLRLGAVLGSGAVATVLRVEAADGRVFAGKRLHESHGQDSAAAQRFAQEAALLRGIRDDNIVAVYGVAEVEGAPLLLLELVEGPTLAQLIAREAPLGEARLARLAAGVARGLARAHAAGVIHRDLKPANILVAVGDRAKIADFGMARATSLAGVERSALTVLGTPDYMAPESLDPLAVDVRSDLYALGCILFEMATGRPPFTGATAFGVIEAHRRAAIPGLPDSFSAPLRALVASLLAKSPADRPQAAVQVAALLEQIAAGEAVALALPAAGVSGPACAGCGQPLVVELAVCMHCGLEVARVEAGRCTVLVSGPGEPGDKLDSALRARLIGWIAGNPGLCVVAGNLERAIPRVPFTLLTRVSEASGRGVVAALQRLGLEAELVHGGALRSRRMRKKAGALIGRTLAVVAASCAGVFNNRYIIFLLPLLILAAAGGATFGAVRKVTRSRALTPGKLAAPLREALAGVERVLPAIATARHRHGLRAVVRRSLALAPAGDAGAQEELAQAITAATAATGRLEALDRALAAGDMQRSDDAGRALLHERDTWAARLLSLTAALDAFQVRVVGAAARNSDEAALRELRAQVEALEEVQRGP